MKVKRSTLAALNEGEIGEATLPGVEIAHCILLTCDLLVRCLSKLFETIASLKGLLPLLRHLIYSVPKIFRLNPPQPKPKDGPEAGSPEGSPYLTWPLG